MAMRFYVPGEKKVMQRKGLRMNEKVGRSGFFVHFETTWAIDAVVY